MALTAEERTFVYKLFLETEDPSRIFRSLYERKKALNRRFSIATMCRACQIPSRGYLSEFLNGKRRLNDRYWKPFIKYFGLTGRLAEATLLTLTLEVTEDEAVKNEIRQKLNSLRRSFVKTEVIFPSRLQGMVFAAEVYCTFGLFKNLPTRQNLRDYFGKSRAIDVEYALAALIAIDVIGHDTANDSYFMKENTIRFTDSDEGGINYNSFHLHGIRDAEAGFKRWGSTHEAYFETTMISVEKNRLPEFVEKIKDHTILSARDMESTNADTLIRFNVQIYPLRPGGQD